MNTSPSSLIAPDTAQDRGRQLAIYSRLLREYEAKAREEQEFTAIELPPNMAGARIDPRTGAPLIRPYAIRPNETDPAARQATAQAIIDLRFNLARIGYDTGVTGLSTNDPRVLQNPRFAQYDPQLQQAVQHFQHTNGLRPDMVVGMGTADAINNFYQSRVDALQQTIRSMREAPIPENGVYVDLTSQRVHVMRGGQSVFSSDVIIGKNEVDERTGVVKRTPVGDLGQISGITLHPQWNPGTVGQRAVDELGIQTQPGPNNPLGSARVNMYNRHSVFLHDHGVSSAPLFNQDLRLASLGCIRVKDMAGLMRALVDDRAVTARQFPGLAQQFAQLTQTDPHLAQQLHQHFDPQTQRFRSADGFYWALRQPHSTDPQSWAFNMSDERGQRVLPTMRTTVHAGYRPVQLDASGAPTFSNNFYNQRQNWFSSFTPPALPAAHTGQYAQDRPLPPPTAPAHYRAQN